MYRLSTRHTPDIADAQPTWTHCMSLQHKVIGPTGNVFTHNPFTHWLFQYFSIQDILIFRCVNRFGRDWCESELNLPIVKQLVANQFGQNFTTIFGMRLQCNYVSKSLLQMIGDWHSVHANCPEGYYRKREHYELFDLQRIVSNGKTQLLEDHFYCVKLIFVESLLLATIQFDIEQIQCFIYVVCLYRCCENAIEI